MRSKRQKRRDDFKERKLSETYIKRARICVRKIPYETLTDAVTATPSIGKKYAPYKCAVCNCFHLSTRGESLRDFRVWISGKPIDY